MTEKTLYDILGLKQDASSTDIQSSYENLRKRCEDNVALSTEDRHLRLTALRLAYETLSDNTAKAIYDAKLGGKSLPAAWGSVVEKDVDVEGAAIAKPPKETNWLAVGVMALLGIAGIWLIAQVAYVFLVSRYVTANPPPAAAEARERAAIQDYYQETGVRAASVAEIEMLRVAERQAERERRQEELAERAKEQSEREYERFVTESKRVGDQVSDDLHRAEMERQRVEERERREAEEAARRKEEAEAARIERERARWREVLNERQTE